MCDAQSMISAYGQHQQGQIQGDVLQASADFEASQLRNLAFLTSAKSADDQTQLQKSYKEQMEGNIAAAIVSGAGIGSFESVMAGNRADMGDNARTLYANKRREIESNEGQARLREIQGTLEAKAARLAGTMKAVTTLGGATENYLETAAPSGENKEGESYVGKHGRAFKSHFFKSIRGNY